ncbi:hypothetical protein SARC_07728 [Sphaeroforma arctica JP610]|uniref:Uncharacterized protein n=1 Tax=Sphaeroforma arctica JP610 TaxID=667725 RepID=A0A0L0FT66_9EUKA|nr:hypothetical protein SARC_07728 [Sphaeroforma arctica JP610]KNC79889.1 hypothetical protein SARC_07728 [Sphaeroforma arctica JP610]|eukprot:XP_014153791.1 hypothetical protein SARC_07728 [Sphaeroforma arctica JP610]
MYALGIAYHHWINTHPQSALHTYRSQHSEGKFDFYRSRNQIVDIDEIEQVIRTALLPADVIALEHVLLCVKWTAVLLTVYTVVSVVVTRRYGCRALGKS